VDPGEGGVAGAVEASGGEEGDAAIRSGDVGVEGVGDVFGGMDVGDWGFAGVGVCSYLDGVAEAVPVGALLGYVSHERRAASWKSGGRRRRGGERVILGGLPS
jgi:hypothetical protein